MCRAEGLTNSGGPPSSTTHHMSLQLPAPSLGGATAILAEGCVELWGAQGASPDLQAFPGPQPCREGDLRQEVSGIFSEGGPSSVGLACHWARSLRPSPSPAHTPAHLIGLAGESRSAAATRPTSVPGALFSGTARW